MSARKPKEPKEYHSDKVKRYLKHHEDFLKRLVKEEEYETFIAGWRQGASMALFMNNVESKLKEKCY